MYAHKKSEWITFVQAVAFRLFGVHIVTDDERFLHVEQHILSNWYGPDDDIDQVIIGYEYR